MFDSSRGALLTLPCTPDILITPSDLSTFCKALPLPDQEPGKGPVGINPGRLVKGCSGGTYAYMRIKPFGAVNAAADVRGSDEQREHLLQQRCRIDIMRI